MATLEARIKAMLDLLGPDIKTLTAKVATNTAALTAIATTSTSSTAYTMVLTDAGKEIETTAATAVTLTVPPNSSVAFPVGSFVEVTQMGAGQVTFTPGSGVTIRSRGSAFKIAAIYGVAYLRKRDTDEWVVTGDLTT